MCTQKNDLFFMPLNIFQKHFATFIGRNAQTDKKMPDIPAF